VLDHYRFHQNLFVSLFNMASRGTPLFQVINGLRYFGVGAKVTRQIYKFPETYWIVTKVKLSSDQKHGRVWGRLVWRGRAQPKDESIGSTLQKEWSLVGLPNYSKFKAKPEHIDELIKTSALPYLPEPPARILQSSTTTTNIQQSIA